MACKDLTLRSTQEIDELFKKGVACRGTHVVLILRGVDQGPRRVLFVASRRVGNAVLRNRAKRLMREAHRQLAPELPPDRIHIAWIARASCAQAGMREVNDSMLELLRRANRIPRTDRRRAGGLGKQEPGKREDNAL